MTAVDPQVAVMPEVVAEDATVGGPTAKRFGAGVFWGFFRFGSIQGATFAFNLIAARVLGRDAFGGFSLIQTTAQTMQQLGSLSVSSSATRFVGTSHAADAAKTGRLMKTLTSLAGWSALATGAFLVLTAPVLCRYVYRLPTLLVPLIIGAFVVDLSLRGNARVGILMGLEQYKAVAVLSAIPIALTLGLAYVAGRRFGITGIVAVLAVDSGVKLLLYRREVHRIARRRGIALDRHAHASEHRELRNFMVPAALPGLTSMPSIWFAQALLAREAGTAGVAVFSAAFTLRTIILIVPNVVGAVSFSIMNTERGRGNLAVSNRIWRLSIAVAAVTGICGIVGAKFGGGYALALFGKAFRDGQSTLMVVAMSAAVEAVWSALYQRVWSEGRMWQALFTVTFPRDLTLIIAAMGLAAKFGAVGVAGAHLLSNVAAALGVVLLLVWDSGKRAGRESGDGRQTVNEEVPLNGR